MRLSSKLERTVARGLAAATFGAVLLGTPVATLAQHDDHGGTPEAMWSCATADASATPMAMGGHGDMDRDMAEIEFDQLYIDMMLPHHESIIALSQAALPELTDPRLQDMARSIIDAQSQENAQLTEWRTAWYGSSEPDMSEMSMEMMIEAMPVGPMEEMMREMEPASQVATFCAANDLDLAFIDMTIAHHRSAVDASEVALERAVHPELAAFAEDVIAAQQSEIATLEEIRSDLSDGATPAA